MEPLGVEPTGDVPQPGDILAGKYRVQSLLGRGGMGVVLAVEHVEIGNSMAIKLMLPSAARDAAAVARFLREARAAAALQSEHVVRIYDVGTLDTGSPFIVMELMRGQDLSEYLVERGRLPPEQAVDFVRQACHAVAEAHQKGLVHRDLKPSNLFLTRRSNGTAHIKVLDFGISKALAAQSSMVSQDLTATSAVMGSPLYMSPEQVRNAKHVDVRSDIWSLGIILHELMTGGPAFVADTLPAICAAIIADPAPPLSSLCPDVCAELEAVVARCLEKDITRRYQRVEELMDALAPFAPDSVQGSSAGSFDPPRARLLVAESGERIGLGPYPRSEASLLNSAQSAREDSRPNAARPFVPPAQVSDTQVSSTGMTNPPHVIKKSPVVRSAMPSTAGEFASRTLNSNPPPPSKRRSWLPTFLGGGLVLAVVAGAIGLSVRRTRPHDDTTLTAPTAPTAPTLAAVTAPLGRAAAPSTASSAEQLPPSVAPRAAFDLVIETIPAGAEVLDGDSVLGTAPVRVRVENATVHNVPRRFVVRREGYSSYEIVRGPSNEDVQIVAALSPLAPSPTTNSGPPTAPPHGHRTRRHEGDRTPVAPTSAPASPPLASPPPLSPPAAATPPAATQETHDDIRLER